MLKYKLIGFIILFICIKSISYSQSFLDKENVFLIGRGTTSKQNFITKLNLNNKNLTHIGIGFFENESLVVYNVSSDRIIENSALLKESYSSFISDKEIFYLAIWKINLDKNKIIDIINDFNKEEIFFDKSFDINNNSNKLYCSEFVANVINKVTDNLFEPNQTNQINNKIIKNIAKNKYYYPVDFFLKKEDLFEMIFEECRTTHMFKKSSP